MAHSLYIGWLLNKELIAQQVQVLEGVQRDILVIQTNNNVGATKSEILQRLQNILDMTLFKVEAYIKNTGTLAGIRGQRPLLATLENECNAMADVARSYQFVLREIRKALEAIDCVIAEIQRHEREKP